jgi:hypothetical protein
MHLSPVEEVQQVEKPKILFTTRSLRSLESTEITESTEKKQRDFKMFSVSSVYSVVKAFDFDRSSTGVKCITRNVYSDYREDVHGQIRQQ